MVALRRSGRVVDIAPIMIFLCLRQSTYIIGQVLVVGGELGLAVVFGASLRAYKASQAAGNEFRIDEQGPA